MEIFFILVAVFIVLIIIASNAKAKEIATAKAAYHASLEELTSDPTNPRLRKSTLEFGRAYSNLTRDKKGVSLFDEVALMNDINAACGGTTAITTPGVSPIQSTEDGLSVQDRLTKLRQLKEQGFISESEYDAKRQQLISDI